MVYGVRTRGEKTRSYSRDYKSCLVVFALTSPKWKRLTKGFGVWSLDLGVM